MEREFRLFEQIEMRHSAALDAFLSELEQSGARTAVVRINSPGGSWMAGQKMRASLLASKLKVTTINEGLVGSAATLVYAAGNVRQCQAHAKFMMHQVSGNVSGQVKELKKALASQEALNRSTAEMYVAASNKSVEEWEQMMEAETWISAEEAYSMEYCTQVLPAKPGFAAADATMAAADVHQYYMSLIPQETEMKLEDVKNSLVLAGVKLADNATEADVLAAIAKLQNKAPEASVTPKADESDDSEIGKLRKQLKDLQDSNQAQQEQRIEEVLNSAVSSGRITAANKESYKALLNVDFTNTAKIINELPARQSIARSANQAAAQGGQASGATAARNDWDFDKWSKEDERGLLDMKRNDPDRYQNLLSGIN